MREEKFYFTGSINADTLGGYYTVSVANGRGVCFTRKEQ